ncbi:chloride channel protein [Neisseria animalis]|uniref:Chloride channel protein n=1 Tax=Neisseria animalis TaxID=492 RepID=A0A5P3MTB8_NEIAN|nr:chloride channel protein [Neisseria animalis]QEY23889.1 chloride channel protein [Neisseria animalis]ROW32043.1 chloride channel protein [Neisseria animalis]VEE05796.1 Chloride channel protein-related protein [Neisseria animalis]
MRWKFWVSLTAAGIAAGFIGFGLTELMHAIQHSAFGYSSGSFREGVGQAEPLRRWWVLLACGIVAGGGWWALHRFGKPLVSIKQSLSQPQQGVPVLTTAVHSLLQIITVGMGSPLGREVAPREMSAAAATAWLRRIRLNDDEARILLAAASAAGLAAVYNTPLSAILFALETMIVALTAANIAAVALTVLTAVAVSRILLGDLVQYPLPVLEIPHSVLPFSVAAGLGAVALSWLFQCSIAMLPPLKRGSGQMVLFSVAAFALIGGISMYFPEVLGNGKAGNQLEFAGLVTGEDSLWLLAAKFAAVWLALAAGAYGGLITPSMMMGSTFTAAWLPLWNAYLPEVPVSTAAVVGAAAMLAVMQRMPLTAAVLVLELTRQPAALLLPLLLAVGTGLLAGKKTAP